MCIRDSSYARSAGLPNWDRPSNACLASRIERGEPVSRALLERIGRAESYLLDRGFRQVRVRVRASGARVQVGRLEAPRLADAGLRAELTDRLLALGFRTVTIDPDGSVRREELPVLR